MMELTPSFLGWVKKEIDRTEILHKKIEVQGTGSLGEVQEQV